jgi:hypothetical protein
MQALPVRPPLFFHKRHARVKGAATLGTAEVVGVPLAPQCRDAHISDGQLAKSALWRKKGKVAFLAEHQAIALKEGVVGQLILAIVALYAGAFLSYRKISAGNSRQCGTLATKAHVP